MQASEPTIRILKLPKLYRNLYALFQAFLAQKAPKDYGKNF
jgi:hypothetical protein